jgi:Spy/CpxP family protein refolding chaperone
MRKAFFTGCFVTCILLAGSFILRADQTNTSAPYAQRGFRPLAPNGLSAGQSSIAGVALGGPIGVLTDQQRASYQVAMKELHGRFMELDAKLRVAREDLINISVTEKFDENRIRQKAFAVAQIEAEMTVLRVKAFSQVQPPLTPEQIEKVKTGQPGAMHSLERPHQAPTSTNHDQNGLPPKQ